MVPFEKYLDWISKEKGLGPHYTLHKTLMGLMDMYRYAGNKQALEVLCKFADWFMTGPGNSAGKNLMISWILKPGMLEVWADLYGITGDGKHLELLRRYDRPRL